MDALGALGAFDEIQAQLKAYAGEFLSADAKLRSLTNNPSLEISTKAQQLLAEHKVLEEKAMDAQGKIEAFKNGAWTMSDVIEMSGLALNLQQHLSAVNRLQTQAGGVTTINAPFMDELSSYLPMIGVGVIGIIGLVALSKK